MMLSGDLEKASCASLCPGVGSASPEPQLLQPAGSCEPPETEPPQALQSCPPLSCLDDFG